MQRSHWNTAHVALPLRIVPERGSGAEHLGHGKDSIMAKALSVAQPWAWAIIHGSKRIENRRYRTSHRGPLFIHASKSREWLGTEGDLLPTLPPYSDLVYGAIIGVVDVVDCVPVEQVAGDPFAEGPWCWILENPRAIEPFPCRGQQNLFSVPLDDTP